MKKSIVENSRASRGLVPKLHHQLGTRSHTTTTSMHKYRQWRDGKHGLASGISAKPASACSMPTEDSFLSGGRWNRLPAGDGADSRAGPAGPGGAVLQLLSLGPARMLCPAVQFQQNTLVAGTEGRTKDRAAPYRTVALRTRLSSSNERRLSRPRFASVGLDPGYRVCVFLYSIVGQIPTLPRYTTAFSPCFAAPGQRSCSICRPDARSS